MNNNAEELISEKTLHHLISLIESIANQDRQDSKLLCQAGRSYFALQVYYRSHPIQKKLAEIGKTIDLQYFASQAFHYFNLAAQFNNGLALHYLGHFCQNGIGIESDLERAFQYFESAVNAEYYLSWQRIAYFYQQGWVVDKNIPMAIDYYEKVISISLISKEKRQGLSLGFCNSAEPFSVRFKQQTLPLPKQYENTLLAALIPDLIKKVENGLIAALTNVSTLYFTLKEDDQNRIKAYEYLNKAAQLGSPYAQNSLGNLYCKGEGVRQDYQHAFELYKLAARQNFAPALISLGVFYQNGYGVPEDSVKARQYYEAAVASGDLNAFVHLGYCYQTGIGTDIDFNTAFHYYLQAAHHNHSVALQNLKSLFLEGYGDESARRSAKLVLTENDLLPA